MSTLNQRTATVVIIQGDDAERVAELRRAVEIASARSQANAPLRMGEAAEESGEYKAAKAAHDEFVDAATDRSVIVHLKALPRKAFRSIMLAHPPRDGNEDDDGWGVNFDTFGDALLSYDRDGVRTIESVEPETPDSRQAFIDELAEGDYNRIFTAAYYLNRGQGADPKELRYSPALESSDAT